MVTEESIYTQYGLSRATHTIVRYNKKNTVNMQRQKRIPPDPHGASGGPLFKVLGDSDNHMVGIVLEGVMTRFKDRKYIISTKICVVRDFIENLFFKF
jgi:hypothetical protein